MTSLGPGCALEGILFVCVEDQNYVVETPGQAQHPALKHSPFKVNRTCGSLQFAPSNRRANSQIALFIVIY